MIQHYLRKLSQLYFNGNATEHSYRGDLQSLLQEILGKEFSVINEPQRQACGAPDYIISKKDIPVGFIEAKDLKLGIDHKKNKPQFDRYRNALSNLIITDYLNFDRKGHTLDFQDVLHYQKMIYAMMNTERLMKEIDEVRYTDPSPDA